MPDKRWCLSDKPVDNLFINLHGNSAARRRQRFTTYLYVRSSAGIGFDGRKASPILVTAQQLLLLLLLLVLVGTYWLAGWIGGSTREFTAENEISISISTFALTFTRRVMMVPGAERARLSCAHSWCRRSSAAAAGDQRRRQTPWRYPASEGDGVEHSPPQYNNKRCRVNSVVSVVMAGWVDW